jgi:pSer/pThr/pTyr-binding forkhead associated (FHA) protein
MPYHLKILAAPEERLVGLKVPLAEGANVIGRSVPPCTIQLDGNKVSKRHCTVTVLGEVLAIEDHGSSNGVFLNGSKIGKAAMKAGDRLVLGEFILEITGNNGEVTGK